MTGKPREICKERERELSDRNGTGISEGEVRLIRRTVGGVHVHGSYALIDKVVTEYIILF